MVTRPSVTPRDGHLAGVGLRERGGVGLNGRPEWRRWSAWCVAVWLQGPRRKVSAWCAVHWLKEPRRNWWGPAKSISPRQLSLRGGTPCFLFGRPAALPGSHERGLPRGANAALALRWSANSSEATLLASTFFKVCSAASLSMWRLAETSATITATGLCMSASLPQRLP